MSSAPDLTTALLRREKVLVAASIAVLVALCWWFLARGAGMPRGMATMAMAPPPLSALVAMWWLMMVAMMLPSAAPAILLYARVRETRRSDSAIPQTWVFLAGYLLVWLVFSIAAAAVQWRLVGPSMALENAYLTGSLLLAAGVYQLSPLKSACLRECRSPAQFITRHWRPGIAGALRLGMLHGAYCVGCCWLLMALLFAGGVMNMLWVAALTLLVAAEKLLPGGQWIARISGASLIAWGAFLILA